MADPIQESIDQVRQERPEQADVSISPMNWLGRQYQRVAGWAGGGAPPVAMETPWGSVIYDEAQMARYPGHQREAVLTHELTHAAQPSTARVFYDWMTGRGENPYMGNQGSFELAAYDAEKERALRLGLPPTGGQPAFYPGQAQRFGDIALPADAVVPPKRKKKTPAGGRTLGDVYGVE